MNASIATSSPAKTPDGIGFALIGIAPVSSLSQNSFPCSSTYVISPIRCTAELTGRPRSSWMVLCFDKADVWQNAGAIVPATSAAPRNAANLIPVKPLRLIRASSVADPSLGHTTLGPGPYPNGIRRLTQGIAGEIRLPQFQCKNGLNHHPFAPCNSLNPSVLILLGLSRRHCLPWHLAESRTRGEGTSALTKPPQVLCPARDIRAPAELFQRIRRRPAQQVSLRLVRAQRLDQIPAVPWSRSPRRLPSCGGCAPSGQSVSLALCV